MMNFVTLKSCRIFLLLIICVILASCSIVQKSGKYYQDDGPPLLKKGPKPEKVANAVPRNEPLSRYGNSSYEALGQKFTPMKQARGYEKTGYASWYGRKYHGNQTSNGDTYDMYAMTAAHPVLPLPSYVQVKNLQNGKVVVVRVNDRGPFLRNRIIDLSYMAARKLGIVGNGTAKVHIKTLFADNAGSITAGPVVTALDDSSTLAQVTSMVAHPFILQAGSFASEANARRLQGRLANGGYANVSILKANIDGRLYHRVQIGPYPDRNSAELIGSTIEEFLGSPVRAIPEGVR
ncbi:MAG: rare lipoprotein A [Parasphingorhabdus sp.]|jgi:rare lipoprotein A